MNKHRERRLLAASIVLTLTAFGLGGVLWTVLAGDSGGGGASLRLPGWQTRAVKAALREECGSNRWRIHRTQTPWGSDKDGTTRIRVRWEKQVIGGYWQQKEDVFRFDQNGERTGVWLRDW